MAKLHGRSVSRICSADKRCTYTRNARIIIQQACIACFCHKSKNSTFWVGNKKKGGQAKQERRERSDFELTPPPPPPNFESRVPAGSFHNAVFCSVEYNTKYTVIYERWLATSKQGFFWRSLLLLLLFFLLAGLFDFYSISPLSIIITRCFPEKSGPDFFLLRKSE